MKIRLYILLFISLAACQLMTAQNVQLKTIGAKYPDALSPNDRDKLLEAAQGLINEYVSVFTLLDESQNRVTSESISKFQALFNSTATVVMDYEEYVSPEPVTIEEYFNGVSNRMDLDGVLVRLNEATLLEVVDDGEFWVAVIKAEKDFYNFVTEENEVKPTGGRTQDQEIRLDVQKSDFSRIKIAKISRICRPGECIVKGQYSKYIGVSAGAFKPWVISTTPGGYLEANPDSARMFDMESDFGFSGGIEYFTNGFLPKDAVGKNLFLVLGLRFNYHSYTAKLQNYSFTSPDDLTAKDDAGHTQPYTRMGSNITATEKMTIGSVELPLGIGLRLNKKQGFEIFIQAKALPSYFLLIGSGKLESTGTYSARIDSANWELLAANAINLSGSTPSLEDDDKYAPFMGGNDRKIIGIETNPKMTGFNLAAQLSPSVIFHLSDNNPNWSLMIGADITYNFGSFIKYTDSDKILLRYPNDDNYSRRDYVVTEAENNLSIAQHYLKGMSVVNTGIRIGLVRRWTKNP